MYLTNYPFLILAKPKGGKVSTEEKELDELLAWAQ